MRSAKPGNHLKQSGGKLGLSGTKRNKFFPSSSREFSWAVSSFLQPLYSDPRGHQRFIPCDFAARGFGLRPKMYEPTTNHFSPLTQGKHLWYPEYLHRPSPQHFCSTVTTTTTTTTFSQFSRTTTFFCNYKPVTKKGEMMSPCLDEIPMTSPT